MLRHLFTADAAAPVRFQAKLHGIRSLEQFYRPVPLRYKSRNSLSAMI
jgi:hypothetical protein